MGDLHMAGVDGKNESVMKLKERQKALKDILTDAEVMGKLADSKTPPKEREQLERRITNALADTVTAEIIKRNGALPNNAFAIEFSRRMASQPSFRSVTKPVLQSVYNDYSKYQKNPEAGYWGPEAVNKMVENGTFLVAANEDQKIFQSMSDDTIKERIEQGIDTPGANRCKARYNELKKEVIREHQIEAEKARALEGANPVLKPDYPV